MTDGLTVKSKWKSVDQLQKLRINAHTYEYIVKVKAIFLTVVTMVVMTSITSAKTSMTGFFK